MRLWSELRARWRALTKRHQADRDTEDEIAFHLEMEAARLERSGHSPAEARRRARVAFGGVTQTHEQVRRARGVALLEDVVRDARLAVRQLRRELGFVAVTALTLGLGIGANTAIFSVLHAVLLRPIPVPDADQLVILWETDRSSGTRREPAAWPDYLDYRRGMTATFSDLAALMGTTVTRTENGADPVRIRGLSVTSSYFDVLRLAPLAGRGFSSDETQPGGPRVVVLGEHYWRTQYHASPDVIGSTVTFDGEPYAVIGVAPDAASFGMDQIHARAAYHAAYDRGGPVDVWLPLQVSEATSPRETHPFLVMGRLRPEVGIGVARAQAAAIAADLERRYPSNTDRGAFIEEFTDAVLGPVAPLIWMLVAAVTLVLGVACLNVAGLLLARGTVRSREVLLRAALGADRNRLWRQFATEALILTSIGLASGIAFAFAGLGVLRSLAPSDLPRLNAIGIDGRVLAVSTVIALVVGLIFGLVPTLQARRLGLDTGFRTAKVTDRARVVQGRAVLVAAQVALAVVLLIGAGLLVRSFRAVLAVDPGFRAAGIVKAHYELPSSRYPREMHRFPEWTELRTFHASLLERIRTLPGVSGAAVAGAHPLDRGFTNSVSVVGREAEARGWPEVSIRGVSEGYFDVMQQPVLMGRGFTFGDDGSAPTVAVINRATADRLFRDRDPLGQRIGLWGQHRRIVGVVESERIWGLTEEAPPSIYLPIRQLPPATGVVLVRSDRPFAQVGAEIQRAIWSLDAAVPVFGLEPLQDTLLDTVAQRRFAMVLLGAFSSLAFALALVGVYGMARYSATQRTREFGIRSALGATEGGLVRLVLRREMATSAVGVAVGVAVALIGSRLVTGLLFGVHRADPVAYLGAVVVVAVCTIVAIWIPARRAGRVSPSRLLTAD